MEVIYYSRFVIAVLISSTSGYKNLALNKAAKMCSCYNASYFPASKAVDGNSGREQLDCTLTGVGKTEAWWRVDLGALKSIVSINFTYGKIGQEAQLNPTTRLTNGQTENDGLLEIYNISLRNATRWGTICGQEFDKVDARVACFSAGHLPDGAEHYTLQGNGSRIWLSKLQCKGNEPSLHYCPRGSGDWGDVDDACADAMDVGLRCKNGSTLAGFSVIVSKTDNLKTGQVCYHDNGTVPPSTKMDIPCKAIGRYVFFRNERKPGTKYPVFYSKYAYVQLAELEVYGCKMGYYGTACDQSCPKQCVSQMCDAQNGNCLTTCAAGYKLPTCQETCSVGKFGDQCNQTCSTNCLNERDCHYVTGYCNGGCDRGWHGTTCNEECPDGAYGFNCSSSCKPCDKRTGECVSPGKQDTQCGEPLQIILLHGLVIVSAFGNIVFIATSCVLWFKIKRIARNETKQDSKEDVVNSSFSQHVNSKNTPNPNVTYFENKTQVAKEEESQYLEPIRKKDKYEALISTTLDSNKYEKLTSVNKYEELSDARRDKHEYDALHTNT